MVTFTANEFLWQAAKQGKPELIRQALDNGANINCKLDKGLIDNLHHDKCSPLLTSSSHGYPLAVEYLLLRGSSITEMDKLGNGAIHYASFRGHDDVIAVLLDYGAEVNQVNKCGWTPLHYASSCGKPSSVRLLLENGANASAQNGNFSTALQLAGYLNVSQKRAVETVFQEFMKESNQKHPECTSTKLFSFGSK